MKKKISVKNGASAKRARIQFKPNEIESVKTFATDDNDDYEEEEEEIKEEEEDKETEEEEDNDEDDDDDDDDDDKEIEEEEEEDDNDDDDKEIEEEEENESNDSEMEKEASEHNVQTTSNAGWADAMQKILKSNKPKGKKTLVLAKAKKLCDVKVKVKEEGATFEIDGEEEKKEVLKEATEHIIQTKPRIREKNLGIRVKPSIMDRERERTLQKIATKGVVQLFNAVKQQQTDISKKMSQAGPLERKHEQVLKNIDKNAFLNVLMGKSIPVDNPVKSDEESTIQDNGKDKDKDKTWSVLRDDFVMKAKLKDWDKRHNEEEDSSAPEEMDSDD